MKYPIKYMMLAWLLIFGGTVCAAAFGSKAVSAMNEISKKRNYPIIIIDAGHGGEDGGAVSCTGVKESSINLRISLRLRDLLNLLGYHTYMIRTTDVSISTEGNTIASRKLSDLKNRVRIIHESTNPILVSIHQNYFTDSKYYGPQVFYNNIPESKVLAMNIQKQFTIALAPKSNRLAKESEEIYLLNESDCVGVLIECGFLSNPKEEKLLRSEDYQKKIAAVIAVSISAFLS